MNFYDGLVFLNGVPVSIYVLFPVIHALGFLNSILSYWYISEDRSGFSLKMEPPWYIDVLFFVIPHQEATPIQAYPVQAVNYLTTAFWYLSLHFQWFQSVHHEILFWGLNIFYLAVMIIAEIILLIDITFIAPRKRQRYY